MPLRSVAHRRTGFTRLSVRLAIALAFAAASVVVLALPQIVVRLHTTISHVTWVITAHNLALIPARSRSCRSPDGWPRGARW
jgi:hypothetical protein